MLSDFFTKYFDDDDFIPLLRVVSISQLIVLLIFLTWYRYFSENWDRLFLTWLISVSLIITYCIYRAFTKVCDHCHLRSIQIPVKKVFLYDHSKWKKRTIYGKEEIIKDMFKVRVSHFESHTKCCFCGGYKVKELITEEQIDDDVEVEGDKSFEDNSSA